MKLPGKDDLRFESLKCLLLDMAQGQRSCHELLRLIVNRIASRPNVALARIWLVRPGDLCSNCFLREECRDHERCLHLVASSGRSFTDPDDDWSRVDGHFRRFPLGSRKVGRVASSGVAVEVRDGADVSDWLGDSRWLEAEGIRGFGAQPLAHRDEVLGVLAVFTRSPLEGEALVWLRMIADHAAAAIANARAFEEIERLRAKLEAENQYLRAEVGEVQSFGAIVGTSPALRSLIEQVDLVAPTDANVLILGESGTGKELVAHEIHERSARAQQPLVRVNCAAIPRELYESEFFGHVKGAFTGAVEDREGRFALADGGTLFLDEVGEIPLDLQAKLLRVLQEGAYERVGDGETRQADVRVVATTNRDLKAEVAAGRFRQDLYYRLNVFPIEVSPLRERLEDVPLLAEHFVRCLSRRQNRPSPRLTRANVRDLQAYDWPGNVRELRNVVERALITARDGKLGFSLPTNSEATAAPASPASPAAPPALEPDDVLTDARMKELERENLRRALERAGGKVYGPGGAAELLDMKPTTLASRLKKLGLAPRGALRAGS